MVCCGQGCKIQCDWLHRPADCLQVLQRRSARAPAHRQASPSAGHCQQLRDAPPLVPDCCRSSPYYHSWWCASREHWHAHGQRPSLRHWTACRQCGLPGYPRFQDPGCENYPSTASVAALQRQACPLRPLCLRWLHQSHNALLAAPFFHRPCVAPPSA